MPRTLILVLFAFLSVTTSHARLGETAAQLRERFGRPEPQVRRDDSTATWFFEGQDGQLVYTVTFNAQGRSIAEGLKPLKRAILGKDNAQNFIDGQLLAYKDATARRIIKAGEKYTFGGKEFICLKEEYVVLDVSNDILIVWTHTGLISVLAVSSEMIK